MTTIGHHIGHYRSLDSQPQTLRLSKRHSPVTVFLKTCYQEHQLPNSCYAEVQTLYVRKKNDLLYLTITVTFPPQKRIRIILRPRSHDTGTK